MNKIMGAGIIVLGLAIGIVPLLTDCLSQGLQLTTSAGMKVPMKCHWTAVASVGIGVPLVLIGIMSFITKSKETLRSINIVGLALGALAILFPTLLIGVCANPDHICNLVEKPVLLLGGTLVVAASLVNLVRSFRMVGQPA